MRRCFHWAEAASWCQQTAGSCVGERRSFEHRNFEDDLRILGTGNAKRIAPKKMSIHETHQSIHLGFGRVSSVFLVVFFFFFSVGMVIGSFRTRDTYRERLRIDVCMRTLNNIRTRTCEVIGSSQVSSVFSLCLAVEIASTTNTQ